MSVTSPGVPPKENVDGVLPVVVVTLFAVTGVFEGFVARRGLRNDRGGVRVLGRVVVVVLVSACIMGGE